MSIPQGTRISSKPAISHNPVVTCTLQRACGIRHQTVIGDHDDPRNKSQMLENKAIGLQSRGIYSRSDDNIVGFSGIQRKSAISEPGDQYEVEADRIADEIVNQDRARDASFIHHSGLPLLQRQEQSSPQPSLEGQYKNAAKKAGEAFLKTNLGRDIKDKALKQGKDFISTLRGKIITGTAAAGVVSALAATNSNLPMQVPEIPLDLITPGLKVKLNYDGPVRNPTSASLTFTYVVQVEKKERKGEPTEREKFRAETARIAEDQAKFREGLKTPEQKAAEHDQFMKAYWARKNQLGLDPIRIPSLVDDEGKKPSINMRDIRPKRDEEGLHRKAEGSKSLDSIPPIVHEVIGSPGRSMEPDTRAFMEEHFGYDFSRVRVHTDGKAAQSARAVNAKAYTIGHNLVFGLGQYDPNTKLGQMLLTHELTHVVQQEHIFNSNSHILPLQRFSERPHKEIENIGFSKLQKHFLNEERKQIALGNWQNDFNQISLIIPELAKIGLTITKSDCFDIGKIIAEDKFGSAVSNQMDRGRFGEYRPAQHFDNPNKSDKPLGNDAIPDYIISNIQVLKETFEKAIDAYTSPGPEIAREYFGSALHIIEDFFAHSNFVEIALNLRGNMCLDTFGGTTQSGEYRLITGNFEQLDSVVSILKIINSYLSEPFDPKKGIGAGDRILIILIRRQNPTLAQAYEGYLNSIKWAQQNIPGFKYIYRKIQEVKTFLHSKLAQAINLSAKELAGKTGKGIQPSHTQVNKDDPTRDRYFFAKSLAVHVVENITPLQLALWQNPSDAGKRAELFRMVDTFTKHPGQSTWWYPIIDNYLKPRESAK